MIKYLFCVNKGHGGSKYLSELLNSLGEINGVHEPLPIVNKSPMQKYINGYMYELISQITKISANKEARKDCMFFKSIYCFIKGFRWEIPKHIASSAIGVIILKRNSSEVAEDLLRINCLPFNQIGKDWIIVPHSNCITSKPISILNFRLNSHLQLFSWHISKKSFNWVKGLYKKSSLKLLKWYVEETYVLTKPYIKN